MIKSSSKKFNALALVSGSIIALLCIVAVFMIVMSRATHNSNVDSVSSATRMERAILPVVPDDHLLGSVTASVFIIMYADFECPYCKEQYSLLRTIYERSAGRIGLVYRHFPLPEHTHARELAIASECAAHLGGNDAFWKYVDSIYGSADSKGKDVTTDQVLTVAKDIGLSQKEFASCLSSDTYTNRIDKNIAQGSTAGMTGTPGTFVVNGSGSIRFLGGARTSEEMQEAIDSLL